METSLTPFATTADARHRNRQTEASAEFVAPLLAFSRPEFHFSHVWDPEAPMAPSAESLEMKNTGQLPLDLTVKTQVGCVAVGARAGGGG